MVKLSTLGLFGALCLLARPAHAQEFGKSGQLALSAERLFGFLVASDTESQGDVEQTNTNTSFSLFTNPVGNVLSAYSFARVGGDYFVSNGLSVGAALGIFTLSQKSEAEGPGAPAAEQDGPSTLGFLAAPRVGYAFMFNPTVGIWPRAGITYVSYTTDNDEDTQHNSSNRLALTLEVPLVLVAAPHVAFTVGPTFDLGLSGSDKTEVEEPMPMETEEDHTATEFGILAGMTVFL